MADYKLNLTPPPIKTEPEPLPPALPETATPSTFEVGSGSEGPLPGERLSGSRYTGSRNSDDTSDTARRLAENARDKFHDVAEEARDRMNDVAHRASDIADEAGHRLNEIRDRLNERLPIWKQQALDRVDDARFIARRTATEANQKARQYPIHTIAVAAGAGFLIGATMRIWRSSRG